MTAQEAYDKMRAFYSREDTMLGRDEDACEYVHFDGETADEATRCAVGCVLPMDFLEEYGRELNATGNISELFKVAGGEPWGQMLTRELLDTTGEDRCFQFLRDAQEVHDDHFVYPSKADVIVGLDELADSYGLSTPHVNEGSAS